MSAITGQADSCTIFSTRWSACSELSPRPTRATSGRSRAVHCSDVLHLDLARDHFVPERGDDRWDERQAILALVRDQNAQVLSLAVTHLCVPGECTPCGRVELGRRTPSVPFRSPRS